MLQRTIIIQFVQSCWIANLQTCQLELAELPTTNYLTDCIANSQLVGKHIDNSYTLKDS